MIIAPLNQWSHYRDLGPSFVQAMAFLHKAVEAPAAFAPGRHAISDPEVFATLSEFEARAPESAIFEWHRRLADIHVNLSGDEALAWAPALDGLVVRTAFDESRDFGTYLGPVKSSVVLPQGHFAVFLPGELHAPGLGAGSLRKWVAKFPIGDNTAEPRQSLRS